MLLKCISPGGKHLVAATNKNLWVWHSTEIEKVLLPPPKFLIFPVVFWEESRQNLFCSSSYGATAQLQLFLPEAADGTFQPPYLDTSQCRNNVRKKYNANKNQGLVCLWKYLTNRGFRRKFFCTSKLVPSRATEAWRENESFISGIFSSRKITT